MINWKEYPQNKPDIGWHLVWVVCDVSGASEYKAYWDGTEWLSLSNKAHVTHFTEINPPSEPINQPSLYNCC